jgi:hypothetical protein
MNGSGIGKMKSILIVIVTVLMITVSNEFVDGTERLLDILDRKASPVEIESRKAKGIFSTGTDFSSLITEQISDSAITEYISRLVDFRTRLSCTDSNTAASQWIHDKFLEFGYIEVYFDSFPFHEPEYSCDVQWNVVAIKQGTLEPEKVIVLGGHYDSIADYPECDPDTLAPGADDDASGTAAVLEAARVLADEYSDVTLLFIAFGAEEQQMIGSTHFAEAAFAEDMDIKLMLNMDMIGNYVEDVWDVELWSSSSSLHYAGVVAEIAVTHTNLLPITIHQSLADAYPFDQLGYHNVGIAEPNCTENPQLHTCYDEVEYLSIPYLTEVTDLVVRSVLYVANIPMPPTGFGAANVGNGTSLLLHWDQNEESDIFGYKVYYGTQSGEYDSIKTVTSTEDTLKQLIDGTAYFIALSAVDNDENESFLTNEVEIVASSVPSPPTGLTSMSYEESIHFWWERNETDLDLAGYNLYRYPIDGEPDTTLVGFVRDPTSSMADTSAEAHVIYTYFVTAVDTQVPPNESEPSEENTNRLATHDLGILVVDNTLDGSGGPFSPTDEQVDVFYEDILSSYKVNAFWDITDSLAEERQVMDYDIGIYSLILWHSDVRLSPMMAADTTVMRKYLEGGGNLWISGWDILESLTQNAGPDYLFETGDFISHYVGIDSARSTGTSDRDFIGAMNLTAEFPPILIDSAKIAPLSGLYDMDVLLPPFDTTFPLYSYVSSDSTNSPYHDLPVAVAGNLNDSNFIFTDFPLYFMDTGGARYLVEKVMEMFDEPVSIAADDMPGIPVSFSLSQNYPNPFNPMTTIRYDIPDHIGSNVKVILKVYSIRGRLIKTVLNEHKKPGSYEVVWDGRDERGNTVSSGVYFYSVKAGEFSFTRKMIVMK